MPIMKSPEIQLLSGRLCAMHARGAARMAHRPPAPREPHRCPLASLRTIVLMLGAAVSWAAAAPAPSPGSVLPPASDHGFVLFDLEFVHRGDRQLYRNWNFETRRPANPDAPANWLEGDHPAFELGIYEWSVEVIEMERPWESPMSVQFGWWNMANDPVIRHIASPALYMTELAPPKPGRPWKYRQVRTVRALDFAHMYYGRGPNKDAHVSDWDWSNAFAPGTMYTLINPRRNNLDADGDGKVSEEEYPDIKLRTNLRIHLPGSASYDALVSELAEGERVRIQRALNPVDPEAYFVQSTVDAWGPNFAWGKCAADLNGDGKTDLIVGGWREGGLVWYEAPHWTKHIIDANVKISTDIEVADVDQDGLPDVIAITSAGVVWYRNPDWKPHVIATDTVHDIEVGDFDGNGTIDVIARNQNLSRNASGATLFIYLQNPPGQWTRQTLPIPDGEGLKAADLDRDGDLDIVINGVWYENRLREEVPDWREHRFGVDWTHDKTFIDVADMNGNGRLDVLLAPSEPKGSRYRISWFESPPDPRRTPWKEHVIEDNVETVYHFIGVADFNGDGLPDVVSAAMLQGNPPNEVKVYLNTGRGWNKQVIGTQGSHSMRILQVEGSRYPSLFGANHQQRKVELWRNVTAEGRLPLGKWRRHVIDAERPDKAIFIQAADLDRDGRKDIAAGAWWYRNPGRVDGQWIRRAIGEPLNNMAVIFDFDGDGHPDVLGTQGKAAEANPRFAWARNDGTGNFTIHTNIQEAVGDFLQGAAVNQFVPNGPVEVALSWHAGTGRGIQMLTVPKNPMSERWSWRRVVYFDQEEELTAGDLDRDGLLDLVLGTTWLRNERTKWSVFEIAAPTAGRPDRHRLADMNGNGRLDVVVGFLAISRPGKLAWFEAPADPLTGTWREHIISTDVVGPMSLDIGDLDGDGDIDIVVGEHNLRNPGAARLFVFENLDGRGTQWARHLVHEGDEHHDGAQLVDIDGDGDLDIISIGWGHSGVILYENLAR